MRITEDIAQISQEQTEGDIRFGKTKQPASAKSRGSSSMVISQPLAHQEKLSHADQSRTLSPVKQQSSGRTA
jgi:hypothetical protein